MKRSQFRPWVLLVACSLAFGACRTGAPASYGSPSPDEQASSNSSNSSSDSGGASGESDDERPDDGNSGEATFCDVDWIGGDRDEKARFSRAGEKVAMRNGAALQELVTYDVPSVGTFVSFKNNSLQQFGPRYAPLYRVDCEKPERSERVAGGDGVHFGWALQGPDSPSLYTAATGGIVRYDIETGRYEWVLRGRRETTCAPHPDAQELPVTYRPIALHDDRYVVYETYAQCGYERVAVRTGYGAVDLDTAPGDPFRRSVPSPVTSVSGGPGGSLWITASVGDGGLLRSRDNGFSWEPVSLTGADGELLADDQTGARVVRVAASDEDRLADAPRVLVVSEVRQYGDARGGIYGGRLYLTDDGGQSCRAVPLPEAFGNRAVWTAEFVESSDDGIRMWAAPSNFFDRPDKDGNFESVCRTPPLGTGERADCPGDPFSVWKTSDLGEHWERVSETLDPPRRRRTLSRDGTTYRAKWNGLFAESADGDVRELFPDGYLRRDAIRSLKLDFVSDDLDVEIECLDCSDDVDLDTAGGFDLESLRKREAASAQTKDHEIRGPIHTHRDAEWQCDRRCCTTSAEASSPGYHLQKVCFEPGADSRWSFSSFHVVARPPGDESAVDAKGD